MSTEKLEEVFGLIPKPPDKENNSPSIVQEGEVISNDMVDVEDENDRRLARETYRNLIHKSTDLLETLTSVAEESESPRAFEVASTLIRTLADVASRLEDSANRGEEAKAKRGENNVSKQVNNLYVSSAEELLKLIRKKNQ